MRTSVNIGENSQSAFTSIICITLLEQLACAYFINFNKTV